jgi:hypothetical protein
MFLKLLILSVILVAFTMLALGVKLLFDKEPSFTEHACAMEDGELNNNGGGCSSCEIKEIANCTENETR